MITIVCIVFTVSDTKVSKNHLTNKSYRETEILFCQKQMKKKSHFFFFHFKLQFAQLLSTERQV